MKAHQREDYRTARDVAIQRNNHRLVPILEPQIHHRISDNDLESIERHVHALMTDSAGAAVGNPVSHCHSSNTIPDRPLLCLSSSTECINRDRSCGTLAVGPDTWNMWRE